MVTLFQNYDGASNNYCPTYKEHNLAVYIIHTSDASNLRAVESRAVFSRLGDNTSIREAYIN